MQLTPLAFAATAAAFVIIPELSEADENIFKALPIDVHQPLSLPMPAESHAVSVPCRQCEGHNSSVQLNFDVVDHTRLLLNGFEVYPNADPWHGDLTAAVESADLESTKHKLGYSLAIAPEFMDKDSFIQLLNVELRVIEVGDRFVDGIPVVDVKLVKAPSGEIAIANVNTASTKSSTCNSMSCHAKEVMAEAYKALKGFSPFKGCHRQPHNEDVQAHHRHPHHHHFGGGKHTHEWGRLISNVAAQIFLPVLMGITAGVGVALFAMAVCSLFFRLSFIARGRRDRGFGLCPYSKGRDEKFAHEDAVASEKAGLMAEEDEVPPQYEDPKN
ncbi:hypothetical protein ED733_003486 [Metarhizium rileyi]|uniref:DUF7728 domain-containing protein n=1 Tax=Metarhizium rileyi (strain RCEF 4871) TaxID=1649241 RepID=A0A5C6G9G9_METRR|nr:hypothetical protein ED733_003486 [Metarhizium rileyi]